MSDKIDLTQALRKSVPTLEYEVNETLLDLVNTDLTDNQKILVDRLIARSMKVGRVLGSIQALTALENALDEC